MLTTNYVCCHTLLKQRTSSLHKTLDNTPLLKKLMSHSLSVSDYQRTLTCLYAWYEYTESLLDKELCRYGVLDLPGFKDRINKSRLLRVDLAALNTPDTDNLSGFDFALPTTNLFTLLGICYVVEGSALGGLVLGPRLRKVLPTINATSFYDVYGDHKMKVFKEVMIQIQQLLNTQYDLSQNSEHQNVTPHIDYQTAQISLIQGAETAFSSLINWVKAYDQQLPIMQMT